MEHGSEDKAVAFAGMWTVLVLVAVSIAGTIIMRRVKQ